MKETTWSKLRELWAIRRHCKQIELDHRQQRWEPETTGGTNPFSFWDGRFVFDLEERV